jgi:Uma2 family endonuclease
MSRFAEPRLATKAEVYYPEEDDNLMGETDFHMDALILLREGLEDHFAEEPRVYVASDMFVYYVEGDPRRCKSPDVMVVKGVARRRRRIFKTWEEGVVPCTAFEISSGKTWREDVGAKRREYAQIGVIEYIVFDPEGVYLQPVLRGWRLGGRRYVAMKPAADGSLESRELGLRMVPEGVLLRLIDVRSGKPIPTRTERAEALAAEVERLRAELAQAQQAHKPPRRGRKKSP